MGFRITFDGVRRPLDEWVEAIKTDPFASKWEGGKVVDADDLPFEVFDDIAAKFRDAGLTGYGVYLRPNEHGGVRYALIEAAAKHAGVEPPPRPRRMGDAVKLIELVEVTENIEDEPMEDGVPKDIPTSASSSTSPEPTDGPEPSSENNPSDGSSDSGTRTKR